MRWLAWLRAWRRCRFEKQLLESSRPEEEERRGCLLRRRCPTSPNLLKPDPLLPPTRSDRPQEDAHLSLRRRRLESSLLLPTHLRRSNPASPPPLPIDDSPPTSPPTLPTVGSPLLPQREIPPSPEVSLSPLQSRREASALSPTNSTRRVRERCRESSHSLM